MKNNFTQSLTRVLKDEGGYSNNPADPGGPTNFGITIADYRRYINAKGTAADVKRMKLTDAQRIYKLAYWDALNCDGLPSGVDYCVFDYGVNSGIGKAKKVLARFANIKDPAQLINAICDERMAFLRSLGTFSTFGAGWTRRVAGVRTVSIQLAHKPAVSPVVTHTSATVAGAGAATVATAVVSSHPHYWPYVAIAVGVSMIIALGIYLYKKGSK